MERSISRFARRGPILYGLGGLVLLLAVTASVMLAFSAPPPDPTGLALAGRVGINGPLADSLRGIKPDDLDPIQAAALDVDSAGTIWIGRQRLNLREDVIAFYRARALQPAWTDSTARETILSALRESTYDGLNPEDYHADALTSTLQAIYNRAPEVPRPLADTVAADLDLALTDALFRFADDVGGSRIDPNVLYGSLAMHSRQRPDVALLLEEALGDPEAPASGIRDVLAAVIPQHEGYQHIRRALQNAMETPGADTLNMDLLRLNLERWRWLPNDLGDMHVMVDVPGYTLELRERAGDGYATAIAMKVVVGKPGRWQTPVMTDTMETIVFSPTWSIPASIQRESYGYVQRGGRVMQPGPSNPMGRVKFLFPNDQAIYIHDTNSKWGFSQDYRALSHGCVRAADPRDFATAILSRTNGWTVEEVAERFEGRWSPETVSVDVNLPVHLTYFTAWADASGRVRLTPDIYRRDAALADALGLSI